MIGQIACQSNSLRMVYLFPKQLSLGRIAGMLKPIILGHKQQNTLDPGF